MKTLFTFILVSFCFFCKSQELKIHFGGMLYTQPTLKDGFMADTSEILTLKELRPNNIAIGKYENKNVIVDLKDLYFRRDVSLWCKSIQEKQLASLQNDLYKLYVKAYGPKYAKDVVDGKIELGMPKAALMHVLGKPTIINRTVTKYSIVEQAVYKSDEKDTYYYFTNGKLTSFQD